MSDIGWGSGFWRALNGEFSRGVRRQGPSEVLPGRKITTLVFEKDKAKLPLLEPLTAYEMRVFRQAGFAEVVSYRRWQARENGDPTWREVGRTRYGLKEGQNPIEVEETNETRTDAVHEGIRPETTPGPQEGLEEQTEAGVRLPVLRVSQVVRGDQDTEEEDRDSRGVEASGAANQDEQVPPIGREVGKVQEGIRPDPKSVGSEAGRSRLDAQAPETVSSLLPLVQPRGAQGLKDALPKSRAELGSVTVKPKRGRPRQYASVKERNRLNTAAWRERKSKRKEPGERKDGE